MKYFYRPSFRFPFVFFLLILLLFVCSLGGAQAASKETYDIVYLRSKDFDKVLDYKEELETILDAQVKKKLKIVGWGSGDYAVIYDGRLSARTVAPTLIKHAEKLSKTGFDEPYASKEKDFYRLFNVCYGMGQNLDSLKEKYHLLYSCLGEEVKRDLFIEETDYGNYLLIYRLRGDEASTLAVAKKHAAILRGKKIATSITKENSNDVVYGESSLINDGDSENPALCQVPGSDDDSPGSKKKDTASVAGKKTSSVQKKNEPLSIAKADPQIPAQVETSSPAKSESTGKTTKSSPAERLSVTSSENSKVERTIVDYIDQLRSKGVIDTDESTGWMVYDLENDRNVVGINADVEFQAASMIKPFIALAYFHQVKAGKLTYDAKSKRQVEAMIQRSSNSATNYIMRKAGGPEQCDAVLKKYYGNIFKNTDIREYIPADGRTYRNGAPPADYVRFLRSLWKKELPYGKEMRRVMALPGRDRLYYGTTIPRGTLVYNKTGTTAHLCGDMGILVTKTKKGEIYPYAIVGIIERRSKASDYGQWMASRSRVIRDVSTLVYEGLKRDHQLL